MRMITLTRAELMELYRKMKKLGLEFDSDFYYAGNNPVKDKIWIEIEPFDVVIKD